MPKNVGEVLKNARKQAEISVKDVSEFLTRKGFRASENTVYSWENNNSQPTPDALLLLCEYYGIKDVLYAFGYDGGLTESEFTCNTTEQSLIEKYRFISKNEAAKGIVDNAVDGAHELVALKAALDEDAATASPKTQNISFIREFVNAAAAGYISPAEGQDYVLRERTSDVPKAADFAVRINGDSMEPNIKDGDVVYVSENKDLEIGDIGIFFVDGDIFCKQYVTDSKNVYLVSLNPKRQDANIVIWENSGKTVFCFGKVIMKKRIPVSLQL